MAETDTGNHWSLIRAAQDPATGVIHATPCAPDAGRIPALCGIMSSQWRQTAGDQAPTCPGCLAHLERFGDLYH